MDQTTTLDPDTITVDLTQINLDAQPMCEAGELCVGDHGPAVARMRALHRCDHREHMMVCQPCQEQAVRYLQRMLTIVCDVCGDTHTCLMWLHIQVTAL